MILVSQSRTCRLQPAHAVLHSSGAMWGMDRIFVRQACRSLSILCIMLDSIAQNVRRRGQHTFIVALGVVNICPSRTAAQFPSTWTIYLNWDACMVNSSSGLSQGCGQEVQVPTSSCLGLHILRLCISQYIVPDPPLRPFRWFREPVQGLSPLGTSLVHLRFWHALCARTSGLQERQHACMESVNRTSSLLWITS